MVLQRDAEVPVWGWDNPSQEVLVEFAGQSVRTKTDKNGRWKTKLAPLEMSRKGQTIAIRGSESVEFEDVLTAYLLKAHTLDEIDKK